MALARYEGVVVDSAGNVVPLATIEVRRDQPGRPIVPLFADRAGTVPIGNPIQADAQGAFGFHGPGGAYRVRAFTGPSETPTFEVVKRYVGLGTAAERDVEELASTLNAGIIPFTDEEAMLAYMPAADAMIAARVFNDPDPSKNGDWIWVTDNWVKQRGMSDTLARLDVVGGTASVIEAEVSAGVDPANVVMLFIQPIETAPGPVSINGKPVLSLLGAALLPGQFVAGRTYFLTNEGDHYRMRTEGDLSAIPEGIRIAAEQGVSAIGAAKTDALTDIEVQVSTATDQAGIAADKAGEAAAALGLTLTAKAAAELAANNASLSVGIFTTTAAGIAATTVGKFFSVPSGAADEFVILYRHDAGPVATEVKRYSIAAPAASTPEAIAGLLAGRSMNPVNTKAVADFRDTRAGVAIEMFDPYSWIDATVTYALDATGTAYVLDLFAAGQKALTYRENPNTAAIALEQQGAVLSSFDDLLYAGITYVRVIYDATGQWSVIETDGAVPGAAATPVAPISPIAPKEFYVFTEGGASNGEGRGTASESETCNPGTAYAWVGGALVPVNGDPVAGATSGSCWPAFINAFHAATGFGVILVPGSQGGSAVVDAANTGSGSWDIGGTLRSRLEGRYDACIAYLEANTIPWQNGGFVWDQGGREAAEILAGNDSVSRPIYVDRAADLFAFMRGVTECPHLPIIIAPNPLQDAGRVAVHEAQRDLAKADANVLIGFTGARTFPARNLMQGDGIHYLQQGYNEKGKSLGRVAAARCLGTP